MTAAAAADACHSHRQCVGPDKNELGSVESAWSLILSQAFFRWPSSAVRLSVGITYVYVTPSATVSQLILAGRSVMGRQAG